VKLDLTKQESDAVQDAIQLALDTFASSKTLQTLHRVQQKFEDLKEKAPKSTKGLRATAAGVAQFIEDRYEEDHLSAKDKKERDGLLELVELLEVNAALDGACG